MMPSSIWPWAGVLTLCLAGRSVNAQVALTFDGTGTRVSYANAPGITAWSISPGIQLVRPWQSLGAAGTYAQFADGSSSLNGQISGSAFSPPLLGLRGEVAASTAGTLYQDRSRSGQYHGTVRLHWLRQRFGAWGGASLGNSWNGVGWLGTRRAEVGGWMRSGPAALSVTFSPVTIGDDLRYADLEGALQWISGPLELTTSGGLRRWSGAASGASNAWGMASGAYWLNQNVAFVASGGTYPDDFAQGLPHGTYVSLGFRVSTRRPHIYPASDLGAQIFTATGIRRSDAALRIRRESASAVSLVLRDARATSVEIMGDFTGWTPVSLTRIKAGHWSVTLPIQPGSYRANVRVDGGPWGVPQGIPSLSDEFSGVVGLLIVE